MRGRLLVIAMVALGIVLAAVAATFRGQRGPMLPLKPGAVLLFTVGEGRAPLGPFAADAVAFPQAHGVSPELAATLATIVTGQIPRATGLVRAGDHLLDGVATIAELLQFHRFTSACFTRSALPFRASGLTRGAAMTFENLEPDAASVAERAASWVLAAGDAPAFAWLHVDRWPDEAPPAFLDRLATALRDRLVVVAVELTPRAAPRLSLRVPGGLLQRRVDDHPMSLADIAPTLLELYGVPIPSGLMEPFLLAPQTRGARFFAYAEPLPEHGGDADALTLWAGGLVYHCDPRLTDGERESVASLSRAPTAGGTAPIVADDPEALAELRRIAAEAFGWQRDAAGVMRWSRAPR